MKDTQKTKVLFVHPKYPDGQREVLAVFMGKDSGLRYKPSYTGINGLDGRPFTINGQWVRACYARIGQHSECYDGMQRRKRATMDQYESLAKELEYIGYNLEILNERKNRK